MDSQVADGHPPVPVSDTGAHDATLSSNRGSALSHLALLTSLLVPIAFLPYMITRRQLTSLRRRVDQVGATTALLKQHQSRTHVSVGGDSGTAFVEQMRQEISALRDQVHRKDSDRAKAQSDLTMDLININEELDKMRSDIMSARDAAASDKHIWRQEMRDAMEGELLGLRQETEASRAETQEHLRQLRGEKDALQSQLFKIADEVQSIKTGPRAVDSAELHKLLQEARQTRAIFGAIGSSLGDIATIIQRVEIELGHERSAGYDPVERLRVLALLMQEEPFEGETQRRGR